MKKLFSFLCLTLVLSIVNAVTPAKVRKVRNSSPYDTLPAKLVTDYRKLAMLHSIVTTQYPQGMSSYLTVVQQQV